MRDCLKVYLSVRASGEGGGRRRSIDSSEGFFVIGANFDGVNH